MKQGERRGPPARECEGATRSATLEPQSKIHEADDFLQLMHPISNRPSGAARATDMFVLESLVQVPTPTFYQNKRFRRARHKQPECRWR